MLYLEIKEFVWQTKRYTRYRDHKHLILLSASVSANRKTSLHVCSYLQVYLSTTWTAICAASFGQTICWKLHMLCHMTLSQELHTPATCHVYIVRKNTFI